MILAKLRYIATISILFSTSILAFAGYDGRYADLPYHRPPIGLYAIITFIVVGSIIKWMLESRKSNRNKTASNSSADDNGNHQKKSVQPKKVYTTYGRYFEHCPLCGGMGWILEEDKAYFNYIKTTVDCDRCYGFGHILNDEAMVLYKEMQQQLKEENVQLQKLEIEARMEEAKKRKLEDEAYERYASEMREKYYAAIKAVKEAGRKVLAKTDYEDKLFENLSEREEKRKKFCNLIKSQPICPKCCGNDKQCEVCHGTGHLFNEEVEQLYSEWMALRKEYDTLRSDFHSIYDNDPSREAFKVKHSDKYNNFNSLHAHKLYKRTVHESDRTRIKIRERVKDEPFCYRCRGTGDLQIKQDYYNHTSYKQVGCPKCKGLGGFRYD